ncbi:MAG: methionyl-tRNA formyltransferase [Ruminococcaceae bacterium]|nr:methionyl-tRNA formyltransferase [Oscillospiraceae bacterium]
MRIVFMGTPDYAAVTLQKLIDEKYDIAAVFAQPDKPVGRKQILTPPATKVIAIDNNIPVFQPKTLRDGEAYSLLKELNPDVIVVVAYGKILPKEILDLPKYGCINGHASLLPKLRGASPIQWSIVTGEKKTGVSTMLMDEGMDTGDILETVVTDIGEQETAEELFDRLAVMSADLMVSTLEKAQAGTLNPIKQNEAEATYAPIIKKEMAHIDFTKTADEICNAVRGFYSWPCAFCFINDKRIKVIKAVKSNLSARECGVVLDSDNRLVISCKDGSVEFVTVQPEGAKVMTASQMLNGHAIPKGTVVK